MEVSNKSGKKNRVFWSKCSLNEPNRTKQTIIKELIKRNFLEKTLFFGFYYCLVLLGSICFRKPLTHCQDRTGKEVEMGSINETWTIVFLMVLQDLNATLIITSLEATLTLIFLALHLQLYLNTVYFQSRNTMALNYCKCYCIPAFVVSIVGLTVFKKTAWTKLKIYCYMSRTYNIRLRR